MNPLDWDAPRTLVYLALFVIVMCRANATYWVGRLGSRLTRVRLAKWTARPSFQRASRLLARHGAPLVAGCFLTVGLQTMVLLAAGIARMELRRFLPAVIIGCALWALLYGTIGFVGFTALATLHATQPTLFYVAAALLVASTSVWLWARRGASETAFAEPRRVAD